MIRIDNLNKAFKRRLIFFSGIIELVQLIRDKDTKLLEPKKENKKNTGLP